jgi:PPOX class probable F420-dependent enzyme
MLIIDKTSIFGARALQRLQDETLVWLTTVAKDGTPFPKPVWFFWDGETVLIYSQPNALAVKHTGRSPRVSLNFNTASGAGGMISLTGAATVSEALANGHSEAFLAKYADQIPVLREHYGEDFTTLYTVLIRVNPDRLMGH